MKKQSKGIISRAFKAMLLVQLMTMLTGIVGSVVDGAVTGRFLGENAMAAFGFTTPVTLAAAIAASILSTGTSLLCSKSVGEGRLERTRYLFSVCCTGTVILAALITAGILFFAAPLAALAGAKGDMISLAADYIRGYGIACPAILLVSVLLPILQMDGEMNRIVLAAMVMTLGDIAADLLNVLVFHGGMLGMALATAISYYLAFLVLLPHFLRRDAIFVRPGLTLDKAVLGAMFTRGIPAAASQIGRLLLTFILNRFLYALGGDPVVAAHAVILSLGNLCMVPGSALGSATEILTGVLSGEEDRSGLVQMMRTALRYNLLLNGAAMLMFLAGASPLVGMFYQGNVQMLQTAVTGARLYALSMLFYGANLIFRSYCQGFGHLRIAYIQTTLDSFAAPLAAALLLGLCFGVPMFWLGFAAGYALVTAGMVLFFKRSNPGVKGVESILLFPESFCQDIEDQLEISISQRDVSRAVDASIQAAAFAKRNKASRRTSYLIGLAVEEAVSNILEYGFADGKSHEVNIRILSKREEYIIRVRDDCALFDPGCYLKQFSDQDVTANIGLRILYGTAADITYLNALKLNNLIIKLWQNI